MSPDEQWAVVARLEQVRAPERRRNRRAGVPRVRCGRHPAHPGTAQVESVVLYMKGTPDFPQCGFSAAAVRTLEAAARASLREMLEDPSARTR